MHLFRMYWQRSFRRPGSILLWLALPFVFMAIYTMVKNTVFNGVRLPSIIVMDKDYKIVHVKKFGYEEYKDKLS